MPAGVGDGPALPPGRCAEVVTPAMITTSNAPSTLFIRSSITRRSKLRSDSKVVDDESVDIRGLFDPFGDVARAVTRLRLDPNQHRVVAARHLLHRGGILE